MDICTKIPNTFHGHAPYNTAILIVQAVGDVAAAGKCCILDIDVQGARLVRKSKLKAIFVFVAPPSTEVLEQRLRGRGTEKEEQIQERLKAAKEEIARYCMDTHRFFHPPFVDSANVCKDVRPMCAMRFII